MTRSLALLPLFLLPYLALVPPIVGLRLLAHHDTQVAVEAPIDDGACDRAEADLDPLRRLGV